LAAGLKIFGDSKHVHYHIANQRKLKKKSNTFGAVSQNRHLTICISSQRIWTLLEWSKYIRRLYCHLPKDDLKEKTKTGYHKKTTTQNIEIAFVLHGNKKMKLMC